MPTPPKYSCCTRIILNKLCHTPLAQGDQNQLDWNASSGNNRFPDKISGFVTIRSFQRSWLFTPALTSTITDPRIIAFFSLQSKLIFFSAIHQLRDGGVVHPGKIAELVSLPVYADCALIVGIMDSRVNVRNWPISSCGQSNSPW